MEVIGRDIKNLRAYRLELLTEIKSLSNQMENFIRVSVGPKYPKDGFKIAVSLTPKVR